MTDVEAPKETTPLVKPAEDGADPNDPRQQKLKDDDGEETSTLKEKVVAGAGFATGEFRIMRQRTRQQWQWQRCAHSTPLFFFFLTIIVVVLIVAAVAIDMSFPGHAPQCAFARVALCLSRALVVSALYCTLTQPLDNPCIYIYVSSFSLSLSLSHTHTQHKGGLSLASLLLTINPIAYGSGAIGLLVGPYAVVQEKKITETEALRQTNKKMAEEVGILKEENERLSGQINRLEDSVKK